MVRACLIALLVVASACKKDEPAKSEPSKVATPTAGAVTADGVRKIQVEANKEGYSPDQIPGKPGEKLVLVFTRTVESSCLAQLRTPDGKTIDLPLGKSVDVPVTVPQSGQLSFACGMDMFHGAIVAQPSS